MFKKNKKIIISIFLLIVSLFILFISLKPIIKTKDNEVIIPELSYIDFESILDTNYKLLNCEIQTDSINLYVTGIKDSHYIEMCKNIEKNMTIYSQNRINSNQKNFTIYVYKNNTLDYKNKKPESIIEYTLFNDFCEIKSETNIPSIEKTDGLLPYEFISFDGEMLEISMNMENIPLLEKVRQIQILYIITKDLNYIDNLKIKLKENNKTYIYDGSNIVNITEIRNFND